MPLLSTFIAEPALSNLKSERRAFIIVVLWMLFFEIAAHSHCFEFNEKYVMEFRMCVGFSKYFMELKQIYHP